MNEHLFSAKILKNCRKSGIKIAWKINDNFAGGVPDAWFLGCETDLWIEFKWLKELPKRSSTVIKPHLSEQQKLWLNKLKRENRPCAVVIGTLKHAIIMQEVYEWNKGIITRQFIKRQITHKELIHWILTTCNIEPE